MCRCWLVSSGRASAYGRKYVTETSTRKPRRRGFPELIEWDWGIGSLSDGRFPTAGTDDTLFLDQISRLQPGLECRSVAQAYLHTPAVLHMLYWGRCETAVLQEPRKTKHGLLIYHLSLTSKSPVRVSTSDHICSTHGARDMREYDLH